MYFYHKLKLHLVGPLPESDSPSGLFNIYLHMYQIQVMNMKTLSHELSAILPSDLLETKLNRQQDGTSIKSLSDISLLLLQTLAVPAISKPVFVIQQ